MNYTTMMIDIVQSKKIDKKDREKLQIYIKNCLETLNDIFKPELEFEVIFSAGDEFQGLFRRAESAVLYFRLLKMLLAPIQIRCGIGYGKWDIRVEGGTSSEQDGPTYHYAREAIRLVQDRKDYDILFNSKSVRDGYLNTLLNTRSLLVRGQSLKQNRVQLLVEMISPLIDKELMIYDNDNILRIYKLIEEKSTYKFDYEHEIFPFDIAGDVGIGDSGMIIEVPVVKGLSSIIAGITKTTRQNIESTIKKANIGYIRNIDLTSILYIKDNYIS